MSEFDRRGFLHRIAHSLIGSQVIGQTGVWSLLSNSPFSSQPDMGEPAGISANSGDSQADSPTLLSTIFTNPPPSAAPWVIWHWTNANVTREGITADIEAMHSNGIGCVALFSVGAKNNNTMVAPPADPLSPYWWDLVRHAISEAARLKLTLAMQICDGWATAGGPWITPELSMQKVVWAEQTVEGGRAYSGPLPVPASKHDYYRDIALFAFPIPNDWDDTSEIRHAKGGMHVTTSLPVSDLRQLTVSGNDRQVVDTEQAGWIQFQFTEPFTLRSVTVKSTDNNRVGFNRPAHSLAIEASDDGITFRPIGALESPRHGWQTDLGLLTHTVQQTTAKVFRFTYHPVAELPYIEDMVYGHDLRLKLASIVLSSTPRVHHLPGKSAELWAKSRWITEAETPLSACVPLNGMIDLTDQMHNGALTWNAPRHATSTRWRILRIGYTTTGATNDPAGKGQGLECDKFNPEAARIQFNGWFGEALKRAGPEMAGKVLHVLNIDSWEAYSQNWSPVFPEEFKKRRGYDLLPYLPIMAGVPMQNIDATEKFLCDIRRTVAELVHDNFFAPVQRLAHERGCIVSAECTAPTMMGDGMLLYQSVDVPTAEFWFRTPQHDKPTDIKDAVSGARMYGKPVVMAEAFTQRGIDWTEHPAMLKPLGDHNFCEGINRLMLHVWVHQPYPDKAPGLQLFGQFGTFFSARQTWWEPAKAWIDYIRRCHILLQQGHPVSDILYFTGEDIPSRALLPNQLSVPLPTGYAYDSINRDALLRLARVQNGRILLENGASYNVLVMPDEDERAKTPQVAAKVREFIAAGAAVVYGKSPGASVDKRAGRLSDRSLDTVLTGLGVHPDVQVSITNGTVQPEQIEWTHRRASWFDLYFISNQANTSATVELGFRVIGYVPELWHPDTGKMEDAVHWRKQNDRTVVAIELDQAASVFVVFKKKLSSGRTTPNTRSAIKGIAPSSSTLIMLDGPWTVRFPVKGQVKQVEIARLESWTNQSDPDVKFFSGTAIYTKEFTLSKSALSKLKLSKDRRLFLELGEVANLAEIRLNGKEMGVLWKPSYTMDVTTALVAGVNHLEVAVTNTWRNRLIGDAGLPLAQRTTWLPRYGYPISPDSPLLPAGLLGPIRVTIKDNA